MIHGYRIAEHAPGDLHGYSFLSQQLERANHVEACDLGQEDALSPPEDVKARSAPHAAQSDEERNPENTLQYPFQQFPPSLRQLMAKKPSSPPPGVIRNAPSGDRKPLATSGRAPPSRMGTNPGS